MKTIIAIQSAVIVSLIALVCVFASLLNRAHADIDGITAQTRQHTSNLAAHANAR